ncbi:Redoxin [Cantharellus anzutake]|uniref:Redoxin n=1 Tax=Cantharellus anzutake TaxID=1750568 RepID=UPI0019066A84|nr:Redoxin [Cantharellus anzutake]XP_038911872.1 Redoxin [Cantharellus anzutake]KAF8319844.1 Redoxin [Cantharellus anzutake]KAF8324876.1 Redoxin [Cantharellus anzutake]
MATTQEEQVTIKAGDTIPNGTFSYVPYSPELADGRACGVPVKLSTDDWKGKKVVLFSVPGAFTPTCHVSHLPGFVKGYDAIKEKGVDVVACVAFNDAWVMSGWGRVEGVDDKILMLSDANAEWSAKLGLKSGERTRRYALIIDDLVVKSVGVETRPGVNVSGAEHILAHL